MNSLHRKILEKLASGNMQLPNLNKNLVPSAGKGPSGVFVPTDPYAGMPINPDTRNRILAKSQGLPTKKEIGPKPVTANAPSTKSSGVLPSTTRPATPRLVNPVNTIKPPKVLSKPPGGDMRPGRNQIN